MPNCRDCRHWAPKSPCIDASLPILGETGECRRYPATYRHLQWGQDGLRTVNEYPPASGSAEVCGEFAASGPEPKRPVARRRKLRRRPAQEAPRPESEPSQGEPGASPNACIDATGRATIELRREEPARPCIDGAGRTPISLVPSGPRFSFSRPAFRLPLAQPWANQEGQFDK